MHFGGVAEALVDLLDAADRGDVLGSRPKDGFQLAAGAVVLAHLDERAAERHTRREVRRVPVQPGAARLDRVFIASDAAELLRECRKRNRRRVRLDPASQFLYARILRHWNESTTTWRSP